MNNVKRYVPVVTLSTNDNIKHVLKRNTSWNKYRFEITAQPKNNI